MDHRHPENSRRVALAQTGRIIVGTATAVALAALPRPARAKAAKADFFYQEKPKEGKSCMSCRLFVAAESGNGSCAVVEGEISPNGWCMAYSPRG
jgi:hypothetical protein